MSSAGAGILVLFGVTAALAAAAASAHASPTEGTAVLDANLPPGLTRQVLHALSTSRDPIELGGLAAQLEAQGYPLTAAALRARAAQLAAHGARPTASRPSSVTPPVAIGALDADLDPTLAQAVATAIATETDPAKLVGFAHELDGHYPLASAALLTKAGAVQAAIRADQAAHAAAQGLDPMQSTVATPAAATTPETPPSAEPAVTTVESPPPTPIAAPPPAAADVAPPIVAYPPAAMHPDVAPMETGPLPSGPGVWKLATESDVARDGTAPRFAALLARPVGTTIRETHGGRLWEFRVLSNRTDPNLTKYAKDVKAWLWQSSSAPIAVEPPPPPLQPVISSRTIKSMPPSESVRQVQHDLNLLGARPKLDEDGKLGPLTIAQIKLFQAHAHLTVDGIAGPNTHAAIAHDLAARGLGGAPLPAAPAPAPSAPRPMPLIGPSPSIRLLQHNLNLLGASPPLVEDGIEGPKTIAQLRSFQAAHGLAVDGIAGPQTHAAIAAGLAALAASTPSADLPPPPPPSAPPAPIHVSTVKDVQHALNLLGVVDPPLVEDGKAGPKTQAAVKLFQQTNGGLVVDGVAGPKTKAALAQALGAGPTTSGAPPRRNAA